MESSISVLAFIVFVVVSAVLILISLFGTKETSYEDALAEQRKQNSMLFSSEARPKTNNRKIKKANKKVKEKQTMSSVPNYEDSEKTQRLTSENSSKLNLHVEFQKPIVIEVSTDEIPNPKLPNKQKHVKKVRSILIQKEESQEIKSINTSVETVPANHFEEIHPKDEFELIRSRSNSESREESEKELTNKLILSQGDLIKENPKIREKENKKKMTNQYEQNDNVIENKVKNIKSNKKFEQKDVSNLHNINEAEFDLKKQEKKEVTDAVSEKMEPICVKVPSNYNIQSSKEKKKKKGENYLLQQISGSSGDLNIQLLLDLVRKAELSRSEVQILIDFLLNKQHEAPLDSEWSEGKADPVQKLKKQLLEKEKFLLEEKEALTSAQAKLREIRAEQQTEKSQQLQKIRVLEEALQAKQLEIQTFNQRFQNQNQKIQQLQSQLNEEALTVHKLREEQATWVVQRQQFEMRLSQSQEAETTVVQLRNELQDLQTRNNQLTIELHSLSDQSMSAKEHQQNLIVQLQHQLSCFKNEIDQKEEFIRQLEESRRDLEHRLNISHRQENEFKIEISQLKSIVQKNIEEIRRLEHSEGQILDELKKNEQLKDEWERKEESLGKTLLKLKSQLKMLEEEKKDFEKTQQNSITNEIKEYLEEIKKLQNDLQLKTTDFQEKEKQYRQEILNANNQIKLCQEELDNFKKMNNFLQTDIQHYKDLSQSFNEELKVVKQEKVILLEQLQKQKEKNDEIRKKNWKVVEALNAAENKLKSFLNSSNTSKTESNKNSKEHCNVKQTEINLQMPNESEEVIKLNAEIVNYRSIIDNMEGVLKNLELHIQKEELSWMKQLTAKEAEIENLKHNQIENLNRKMSELESQLLNERTVKEKLNKDIEKLKDTQNQNDNSVEIEKLSQGVHKLTEELATEKKKNVVESEKIHREISNGCGKIRNGSPNIQSPSLREKNRSPTSASSSTLNEESSKNRNKRHRKKKKISKAEAL